MAGKRFSSTLRVANAHVAVTPSDTTNSTTELPSTVTGLYVGGAGAVKAIMRGTNDAGVVYAAVPVGTFLRGNFKYVLATGTAATNIVAQYIV